MKLRKTVTVTLVTIIAAVLLAGCGTAETTSTATSGLMEEYADALSVRNQLLLGTIELEDTDLEVTREQAAALLTLWQAMNSLTRSGTSAQAEIDALLSQIQSTYSEEQVKAIAAMRLTRVDFQATLADLGIRVSEGTGQGQQGAGRNMSDADRAAREAARAASGGTPTGGGQGMSGDAGNSALLDYVIPMLAAKAQ
jgi:uncharacterized protein YceK